MPSSAARNTSHQSRSGRRARALVERVRGPQAHDRLLVVDEIDELLGREAHVRDAPSPAPGVIVTPVVVGAQRPRVVVDLDHHRARRDERQRGHDAVGVRVERVGQRATGRTRRGRGRMVLVDPVRTSTIGHGRQTRARATPSRRSAATTPGSPGTIASAGGIGPPGSPGVHVPAGMRGGQRRRLGERGRPVEVERVEQVVGVRVAVRHRAEIPLRLDELQDRRVVVHDVRHVVASWRTATRRPSGTRKP